MDLDETIEEEECAICGLELSKHFCHELSCNHKFHYECLLKTFQESSDRYKKYNSCPYCRAKVGYLPYVNGLKKIDVGIHISKDNIIMNNDALSMYQNVPCNYVFKRGKRKGEECGKNCKLGYTVCSVHKK